ncbi:MAG: FtsX-like permease family protein, partial [Ruminococcus sp.]|nr:FtsX-like permease family protein [Ruminococcus sp.]
IYDIYFTMKNPKETRDFVNSYELNGEKNYELLSFYGATGFDGFTAAYYSMITILICLIMFGSISLIYNAFSISVSERTRQFGLLSSVGATKKQLRKMVLFEAFAVSIIGIPSGIIVGLTGIGITLMAIGSKISTVLGTDTPIKICIAPLPIAGACAIALVTVMISAWIPSIRATRITAVEAIRQSRDIKSKNKPIKTPKIVYKLFGMSGMLAQKYFRRSRKKYRSTIVSLFMSIVLFISASAFTEYIMATVETPFGISTEYDLIYYHNNYRDSYNHSVEVSLEDTIDSIKSAEDVTAMTYIGNNAIFGKTDEKYLTEEFAKKTESGQSHYVLYFVDDDSFRELLRENNLDENRFMNPENPLAVAIDGGKFLDFEQGKYIKLRSLASDECEITEINTINIDGYYYDGNLEEDDEIFCLYRNEDNPQDVKKIPVSEIYVEGNTFKSGKTITNPPYWCKYMRSFCFVYPYSMAEIITGSEPSTVDFYIKSDNHADSYNSLKESDNIDEHRLIDEVAENEKEYNLISIIKVFAYGFIILISLIACANVFNTISTNVNLRRRDFAMLRSVGMTNGELRRMTNFECIMYGTKALLFGLPASFGVTVLIFVAMHNGFENDFFIPWKAVWIAVFSVFAVVFATMLYAMSKIRSDNLIETLKNENI